MPADSALGDLAALVVELRAIVEGMRATAARMTSVSASGASSGTSQREFARRAKPELERAERRGIGGTGGLDGQHVSGRGVFGDERSGSWHRR